MADKKVVEQYYTRPPKLSAWEGFKQFLWNGETSQFMGRTASSWGEIYLIFRFFREFLHFYDTLKIIFISFLVFGKKIYFRHIVAPFVQQPF